MPERRFQMVDVFSDTAFKGNPVAVVLDSQGLDTEAMLDITRWMNLSESTFLLPPSGPEADYRVRIFTPDRELPFAGHPTLGSCRAWLYAGGTPGDASRIVQECDAGLIPIRSYDDGQLAFAAPPLLRSGPPSDTELAEACDFLSLARKDVVDAQWIDNGPGWLGILLSSAEDVLRLTAPGSYHRRIDLGIVGPHAEGASTDFELRALFSDQLGNVREDPVTGSLNASVAQWLLSTGRVSGGYTASQGRCVGRSGRISVREHEGDVWIGGHSLPIVDGRLTA